MTTAPTQRVKPWLVRGGIGLGVGAIALATWLVRVQLPTASLAVIGHEPDEAIGLASRITAQEPAPPRFPIPLNHGAPLDETFPSLAGWVHPVTGVAEALPLLPTGYFGSERDGVMRRECGQGHCGVDLSAPRGRPIVAVADGVVVHVDRSRNGKDGRSGRYVRIEHDDGAMTAYMHLDSVARGLEPGDRVEAGQQIGTLGRTGIRSAPPHLHFSLEVPRTPGTHGDHTSTRYMDPAPFLTRAEIAAIPDRRRSTKPAF